MPSKKIWFVTGAGRGMGVDIAKAALAAGHSVIASGRNSDGISKTLGQSDELLAVKLDATNRADADAAVRAAVDRFGRIDVLLNNAANFSPLRFIAGADAIVTAEQVMPTSRRRSTQSGSSRRRSRSTERAWPNLFFIADDADNADSATRRRQSSWCTVTEPL